MQRALTPKLLDSLKPSEGKRYEVRDTLIIGLLLRVSKTGGKVWYVTPRVRGRAVRIKIGTYPILTLAQAREKAREILGDAQLGRLTKDRLEAERLPTLVEIVPEFIELYAKKRNKDWKETQSVLGKFSVLNGKAMRDIKRPDVVRVLDEIAAKTPVRANRALAAIKKLFSWCVDRGTVEYNPLSGLKPPTKEVPRDRVLSDKELAACWQVSEQEGTPFEQFVKLLILTGQRRGEVSGMRWSEVDFERGIWTIPAKRAKNASVHAVPLAPLALDTLKSMPRFLNSDLVFTTNGQTPVSGFGRLKDRLDKGVTVSDWRVHDIRRTVATNLAMMGVQPHVIEAVLNHKSGIVSGVAAVYNRHAYFEEKRRALLQWCSYVERSITRRGSPSVASDGTQARAVQTPVAQSL